VTELGQVLIMDLQAKMAHFRLPDTTVTHASYPFIPRTALHGLLASILGLKDLSLSEDGTPAESYVGIRLMSKVASSFHGISMLGKGWAGSSRDTFNRPVSIEILQNPHYRVFYTGSHFEKLTAMVSSRRAVYHTYLGVCYCPVYPRYIGVMDFEEIDCESVGTVEVSSVVPSSAVKRLEPMPGHSYARAGGFHYEHLGNREFRGVIHMVYEVSGKPMVITPDSEVNRSKTKFVRLANGEVICLW
jgi:CRISPR-associated protein Cas5h